MVATSRAANLHVHNLDGLRQALQAAVPTRFYKGCDFSGFTPGLANVRRTGRPFAVDKRAPPIIGLRPHAHELYTDKRQAFIAGGFTCTVSYAHFSLRAVLRPS